MCQTKCKIMSRTHRWQKPSTRKRAFLVRKNHLAQICISFVTFTQENTERTKTCLNWRTDGCKHFHVIKFHLVLSSCLCVFSFRTLWLHIKKHIMKYRAFPCNWNTEIYHTISLYNFLSMHNLCLLTFFFEKKNWTSNISVFHKFTVHQTQFISALFYTGNSIYINFRNTEYRKKVANT